MRLRFTRQERSAIISHVFDQPQIAKRLETTKPSRNLFEMMCSEDDCESLLDSIAAASNHSETPRQQKILDALFDRLSDDPSWVKASTSAAALDRHQVSKVVREHIERLRPESAVARKKLGYGFRFDGRCIELLEIRASGQVSGKTVHAFAKAAHAKSSGRWKVYWRGARKWIPHEPPTVASLEDFLALVIADDQHLFFG